MVVGELVVVVGGIVVVVVVLGTVVDVVDVVVLGLVVVGTESVVVVDGVVVEVVVDVEVVVVAGGVVVVVVSAGGADNFVVGEGDVVVLVFPTRWGMLEGGTDPEVVGGVDSVAVGSAGIDVVVAAPDRSISIGVNPRALPTIDASSARLTRRFGQKRSPPGGLHADMMLEDTTACMSPRKMLFGTSLNRSPRGRLPAERADRSSERLMRAAACPRVTAPSGQNRVFFGGLQPRITPRSARTPIDLRWTLLRASWKTVAAGGASGWNARTRTVASSPRVTARSGQTRSFAGGLHPLSSPACPRAFK